MRESFATVPRGLLGEAVEPSIASLIGVAEQGGAGAAEELFAVLYSELHRLARRELARHGSANTLSTTTLLHQAYLNMAQREGPSFPDRGHFMGYAAQVMRRLVIDHARNRQAQKRGGHFEITSLEGKAIEEPADVRELSRISDALDQLSQIEPGLAEVVDLKFFCGFSFAEIAAMRNLSERTVQWKWLKARIYLHQKLQTELSA